MKRRSFLGLLGGAVVAPAATVNAEARPLTFNASGIKVETSRSFRFPVAPYEPDMMWFSVEDEDGKRGYILRGPSA